MIRFTHINVVTNSDAYIYSSINIEVPQDQKRFFFNPRVEDMSYRVLELAAVGKGSKKKTAKRDLYRLVEIKAWSGLVKSKYTIKRLKVYLEIADALAEVSIMGQSQRSRENGN